jgi:predicted O-methyltransferase YrrM
MPAKILKLIRYLILRLLRRPIRRIRRAVTRALRRSLRRLRRSLLRLRRQLIRHWRSLTKLRRLLHRKYVFWRNMRRFSNLPSKTDVDAPVIDELIYGWRNKWSTGPEYARSFIQHAWASDGPILECGSGLSTILLGVVAQKKGTRVWSLEHDLFWADKVRSTLKRYGIKSVELYATNLRDYGSYWWYDPPKGEMPKQFSLVVCDGPPGSIPGGRYAMLPIMKPHLKPGCIVLLDDVGRVAEKEIIARWAKELDTSYRIEGIVKPFGVLEVPTLED